MDYAMPARRRFPLLRHALSDGTVDQSTLSAFAAAGEGGINAGARRHHERHRRRPGRLGVTHVDMPATRERVWQAIKAAATGT